MGCCIAWLAGADCCGGGAFSGVRVIGALIGSLAAGAGEDVPLELLAVRLGVGELPSGEVWNGAAVLSGAVAGGATAGGLAGCAAGARAGVFIATFCCAGAGAEEI